MSHAYLKGYYCTHDVFAIERLYDYYCACDMFIIKEY